MTSWCRPGNLIRLSKATAIAGNWFHKDRQTVEGLEPI